MPKSFDNFPIFFTENEKAMLKGTGMVNMIDEEKRKIKEDFDKIFNEAPLLSLKLQQFSLEEFAQAVMIMKSKGVKMTIKGQETLGLVPMQYLFDHSEDSVQVEQKFDD